MHTKSLTKKQEEKYKAIILYLAYRHSGLGKTQLSKLFLYVDIEIYKEKKETIVGDDYIKNYFGPTPCNLSKILDTLEENREIVFVKRPVINHNKHELHLSSKCDLDIVEIVKSNIKKGEMILIDDKAEFIKENNARKLSNYTHQSIYHALEMGEHIPHFIIPYYFDKKLTEEEKIWACSDR